MKLQPIPGRVVGSPKEGALEDSVAVDAKRILLRYGAPISVLDKIGEGERITLARTVSRTTLADRGTRLRELLEEGGYMEPSAKSSASPSARRKRKVRKD